MGISLKEVRDIALLARIEIGEAEARAMQAELDNIFHIIAKMQAVNTDGVNPMSHGEGACLRLREDCLTEENRRDVYQELAPQAEFGLYLVPRVIE
jgi:aspartyl-tRNA(Asn)/glutamyl-tRNA(Gln) amidotransferase subunit C